MNSQEYTEDELCGYLDEMLPVERMSEIEQALRHSESLQDHLTQLVNRREEGQHSVGEIWREHRLSCPIRAELSEYVMNQITADMQDYIEFHLQTVGCRICTANLLDLQQAVLDEQPDHRASRRRKFYESSIGHVTAIQQKQQ